MSSKSERTENVKQRVRAGYGKIAAQECCGPAVSCCGSSPEVAAKLAAEIGYSSEELAALPEGANMGLSCGNPTALASLKPGETVLDLGCGGGFDVFIAGKKVGKEGLAIGVDMTAEMLARARRNSAVYRQRTGLNNVDFRLGEIEHLPAADNSVDVVISNCVINLSPDKPQVWRDIFRVLKLGGRACVSDLALFKPLPRSVRDMLEALIGCVAGAALIGETESMLRDAGFNPWELTPKPEYVAAMSNWNDPLYAELLKHLPSGAAPADYITSLSIVAVKPAPCGCGGKC